jgi:tetratricopeptide (TPR) repeat protein
MTGAFTKGLYAPGSRILGRYDVARVLRGGMGVVYLCYDRLDDRPVALKTLLPEFLASHAVRDRFLREATMWIDLGRHPNIVRAYGTDSSGSGVETYILLQLVSGAAGQEDASLRSWLRPGEPLPVEQALLFALHVARGMRYACARVPNLVHRDLKPENILVGADGQGRVTDFGLATVLTEAEGEAPLRAAAAGELLGRTQLTRGAVGTPLYMAPEQWARAPLDARADVYALGCILYEMLAGTRAVEGSTLGQLEQAHLAGQIRPLPAQLPEGARAFVGRCTALKPDGRPRDWAEVESALLALYRAVAGRDAPAEEAGEQLTREERVTAGWSYYSLGFSYLAVGKVDVALGYFDRALRLGRQEQDSALECCGLEGTGIAYYELGDPDTAMTCYQQLVPIARRIGRSDMEGGGLMELGNCNSVLRQFDTAIGYFKEAQPLLEKTGSQEKLAGLWHNMGACYFEMGKYREAADRHEAALALAMLLKDRRHQSACLGELGNDYALLGDFARAEQYYRACIVVKHEIGDGMGEARWAHVFGIRLAEQGRTQEALALLAHSEQLSTRLGQHQFAVMVRGTREKLSRSGPEPDKFAVTLDELLYHVEMGCRGHQDNRAKMLKVTSSLTEDPQQPSDVRALGQTLRLILDGERRPDLSKLPPRFAEGVKALLKRI